MRTCVRLDFDLLLKDGLDGTHFLEEEEDVWCSRCGVMSSDFIVERGRKIRQEGSNLESGSVDVLSR